MRLTMRIAGIFSIMALCAIGLLYLPGSTNIVRIDVLPLTLFSALLIGCAFLLCMVLIEIPLRTLENHLEKKDAGAIVAFSNKRGVFSRLAALMAHTSFESISCHSNKSGQSSMQESPEVFLELVESASDPILLLDTAGVIVFCNRSAAHLFGFGSGKALCGRQFSLLASLEHQKEAQQRITEATSLKQNAVFDIVMLKNGRSRFNAAITLSPISGKNEYTTVLSVFLRDNTSRKESDDKKQIMEQQLRAVYKMEALGQLARGIAHDLNNSLGAISGFVELLKTTNKTGDPRTQHYISMIGSSVNKSGAIIHQLLIYARKNRLEIMSFNINEVIADIAKLLESSLEKNITIVRELNASDASIVGDPGQIQNSIVNLAINASDAMSGVGGTLTFKTENVVIDEAFAKSRPYKMTRGYYLVVSVSDTGSGMEKATLEHLFEPFFTTKEIGKGTGLGLASVYGTLKSHNGYIEVDSEVSYGSTFTMYLPVNPAVPGEEIAGELEPARAKTPRQTIMVVDDDHSIVEMLGELLSWLGYSVTPFLNAPAAIEYYKEHHQEIDLAIIDWKMPQIDGIECYRRLKAINPQLKALVSTGYCLDEERQTILKEGINGILPKPFMSAELSAAIAEVLA